MCILQAGDILRTRYLETSSASFGLLKLPTSAEMAPIVAQLAVVDDLKQKGNECVHTSCMAMSH